MEAGTYNYWLIWAIYLVAGALFFRIYWRLTNFKKRLWLSYTLRALMLALIVTPWYANTQGSTLAPALMVMTLDAITINAEAATRALLPLLLSLALALVLANIIWIVRIRRKNT